LESLCEAVMGAGRSEGRCTGSMMKEAAKAAAAEGCAAATNTSPCKVVACVSPPAPPP
jgi:hypothetical protein